MSDQEKVELHAYAPGWCLDMVEAEEEVYLELTQISVLFKLLLTQHTRFRVTESKLSEL